MREKRSSDGELMHAVMKDDTTALAALIERWETRLLAFIFRYVQREAVARDLVQETFVRIYRNRDQFQADKAFSSWMFAIAANLCRNHQRWVSRHRETPLEPVLETADPDTPADGIVMKEKQQRIAAAVQSLPHSLKIAVLLYYYEDCSYKDIAEITGCSIRGIESRLYRARKILLGKLKDPAGSPPDVAIPDSPRLPQPHPSRCQG